MYVRFPLSLRNVEDLLFERGALLIVGVGLASNAAICGVLSGVADRYQARIAWAIPILAMLALLRIWSERTVQEPVPKGQVG
ncbi:MAG: hypothetical protein U1E64_14570 [Sphingomonadaceae bacterium]